MKRKCERCKKGTEECIIGQMWLCDRCDTRKSSRTDTMRDRVEEFIFDWEDEDTKPTFLRTLLKGHTFSQRDFDLSTEK